LPARPQSLTGALGIAPPGNPRPRLANRVDLAFVVGRRAQRSSVVEVGAAVPTPVPCMLLQGRAQRLGPLPAPGGARAVPAPFRQARELAQSGEHEPPVPDALPLPLGPDLVHPVVPI